MSQNHTITVFPQDPLGLPAVEWLTTDQVARLLQISPSSLEKARCTDAGPFASLAYHRLGRSVRYSRQDIQQFLAISKCAASRARAGRV